MTTPYVTVVIHGGGNEDFAHKVSAATGKALTREEARRVSMVWNTADTPLMELWQAAEQLRAAVDAVRQDYSESPEPFTMENHMLPLDEASLRVGMALHAERGRFVPSDKQVLWAMNVVGVYATSAGKTLEELLPAAEYAEFVRQLVAAVQNPNADNAYPNEGRLMDAARAYGLAGAAYGDVIFEGNPLESMPADWRPVVDEMMAQLPFSAQLVGVMPAMLGGLQIDYMKTTGERGSTYYMARPPGAGQLPHFTQQEPDGNG